MTLGEVGLLPRPLVSSFRLACTLLSSPETRTLLEKALWKEPGLSGDFWARGDEGVEGEDKGRTFFLDEELSLGLVV